MNAALELGGTKTVVAIGESNGELLDEYRFPTTTPEETLGRVVEWISAKTSPEAIGIAAFGPVRINTKARDWGTVLATPKPHWNGFSITAALLAAFPETNITLETDVNAACLAEARIGAAAGMENVAYITIGTGIGAGILCDGRLLHGALHPEFGHFRVPRKIEDDFAGICPFHGDCLEGMASGSAIGRRWGKAAHELSSDHPAWEIEAWYLAHGIIGLLAISPPQRVVIGGGVSQVEGLHDKTDALVRVLAGGYFPAVNEAPYVVAPKLGQKAGIRGALMLTGL